jgi:RecB family exonuclease
MKQLSLFMTAPDLRLSVSKVKCYSDCNKKYHFAYILKLPRKEFDYHVFGHFVHKILENFHQEILSGCKDPFSMLMGRVYKATLSEYKDRLSKDAKQEAYDIIDSYLQKISSNKQEVTNVQHVEKRFDFHISEHVVLNGMIDRVQIDKDGVLHVCDYKTTKNKKYLKNDFLQLLTYAYVLYSEDPTIKKVRGSYVLLRHGFEHISKEFSIEEILEVKNKYETYAKQIEDELLWRANPTRLCSYCEFLEHCKEGKDYINPISTNGATGW